MFLFVWFFVPETKGLSLEKMDDLFGVTELVKNMEADGERHMRSSMDKNSTIVQEEKVQR